MENTLDSRDERVRVLAYELWERAGCPDGQDLEYWLEAERRFDRGGNPAESESHA
jgi:hypothetical protein